MAKKWLLRLAPLALLFGALPAQAQNASSITGVVTDGSTGKPVDGAVVVVSNPAAKVEETVVTEGGGKFTVPNLPAGQFKLAVSLDGYKPFERSDLNVKENTTLRANAALSPEGVQLEEVVVTGSRIRRKDLTTPAPVTVLNREAVQTSGKVSVGDFLQSLPEQGNAINTGTNNGGDGSVRISLRSLGSPRTLVLVNGRRMVAGGTGADSSVDLNSIPTAAIERIEVLKDGASAVYGSDAIAGVVNIITRKDWSGLDMSLYSGISSRGDAKINDLAVTLGSADDKGSIIFSAGLYDQTSAMAGDRAFASRQENFDATGENSGTVGVFPLGSSRVPNGRVTLTLSGGNALYQWFQGKYGKKGYLIKDNTLTPDAACLTEAAKVASLDTAEKQAAACKWRKGNFNVMAPEGDLYNFALYNYMVTPSRRYNFYTAGDRKLGDSARVFYEAMYVNRQSKQQLAPEPLIIGPTGVENPDGSLVRINKGNYYNPFGTDVSTASRRLDEFGDRIHEEDVNTYRIVAGVDGTLPDTFGPLKGWAWDTSFNYGRTNATFLLRGSLQSSRIAAALGPSRMENGQLVCVGTDGKVVPGCVPLNLFGGAGTITKDQVDYLSFNGTSKGYNELAAFQVNASGDLVKLFGERAAGLAVGFEHRYVAGGFTNDPLTAKNDTSNGGSKDTDGHYSVNEGYGELSLPVVANRPGFEELELTGALRVFDYTNFGSGSTYKLGARWSPIRDVTVRGTYSTAFRAPTISELYSGQGADFPSVSDPCGTITDPDVRARCIEIGGIAPTGQAGGNGDDNSQEKSLVGGNPDLKPETAKIYTLGLVYQPRQVPGLSLTVDYYDIAIKKAISSIGASTIIAGCMAGNDAYCALVGRDPQSHQILQITDLNQNVGEEATSGIDFTGRYDLKTARAGRFGFDGVVTWLRKHDQTLADGSIVRGKGTFDLQAASGAGGSNPEWKGNLAVNWGLGDLGAGVAMKYIGSFKECGDPGGNFGGSGLCYVDDQYSRTVKAYTAWDLYVSYRLGSFAGKTTIMAGINNVFDKAPPRIYNGFANNTDTYAYDQIGRYYYIRLGHTL